MKKQSIWVFQWRKSVHYWWSYILFSPECKELTSMLDPLLYRWGVPPVVIRCVHWTRQMWVLQTWIKALGLYIVMSATGHADGIGFRGHIYAMHWNNSSLPLGDKMIELSNIYSYHETLINFAHHGCACSICVQIIQRILWCYNGFCDFHWNCMQRILCS